MTSRNAKRILLLVAVSLAVSLIGIRLAHAQETRVRVEVLDLQNSASIKDQEIEVLSNVVRSVFFQLPRERFVTSSAEPIDDPACEDECQAEASRQRSMDMVVLGSVSIFGEGYLASLQLYDASAGQLLASSTTDSRASLEDLIETLRTAARELREKLEPESAPQPSHLIAPIVNTPEPQPILPQRSVVPVGIAVGRLEVTSSPPGARVFIHSKYSGLTPLEIEMAAFPYEVEVRMANHKSVNKIVRIVPGQTDKHHFILQRIYPMNPYKKAGHAFFWPGVLVTSFGLISMAAANNAADSWANTLANHHKESSRTWTGVMWGSFGVGAGLMVAGIVSWSLSPGDKEHYFSEHPKTQAWISPAPDGGLTMSYARRF